MNIMIVFGGKSPEYWVSRLSALSLFDHLIKAGHEVFVLGLSKENDFLPLYGEEKTVRSILTQENWEEVARKNVQENPSLYTQLSQSFFPYFSSKPVLFRPDVIFSVVHGQTGEDGVLQGFFHFLKIPFLGCDVLASAIGLEKCIAKKLWQEAGLPVLPFMAWRKQEIAKLLQAYAPHLFTFLSSSEKEKKREDLRQEALQSEQEDMQAKARDSLQKIFEETKGKLGIPLFLKPANGGSSIGANKVTNFEDFLYALGEGFRYYDHLMAEPFIDCTEYEIGVVESLEDVETLSTLSHLEEKKKWKSYYGLSKEKGLICSSVVEITKQSGEMYTFDDKYNSTKQVEHGTEVEIPARLSQDESEHLQAMAREAFLTLGARHYSRMDFYRDKKTGKFYCNEINTAPGFTPNSLFEKAFRASGVDAKDLLEHLLQLALLKKD